MPLILRWPGTIEKGQVNDDLISHLDIAATSLSIANIPIPGYMQGQSLFGKEYHPRYYISSGRDRSDETVDIIRAVRTNRYKYIRNYYTQRSHAQYNQYRDGYPEVQVMRELYVRGKLNSLQASLFQPNRPPEELYDLQNDPYETQNLANSPGYEGVLAEMRLLQIKEMDRIRDMGLLPEPILEELGKYFGNKYFILHQPENCSLITNIRNLIWQGEQGQTEKLLEALKEGSSSMKYWAATGLGNLENTSQKMVKVMNGALNDSSATVRVASALALCKLNQEDQGLSVLVDELNNENVFSTSLCYSRLRRNWRKSVARKAKN